jgi:hypothetical protein
MKKLETKREDTAHEKIIIAENKYFPRNKRSKATCEKNNSKKSTC